MKERILGVEVFGRSADYDTGSDPIVRTTAIEIRKRLAQYYQETLDSKELRIELIAGSYIPRFEFPSDAHERTGVSSHAIPSRMRNESDPSRIEELMLSPAAPPSKSSGKLRRTKKWKMFVSIAALGSLAVATGLLLFRGGSTSSLDRFWGPVFRSSDRVVICVGAKTLPLMPFDQYKKEAEQLIEGQAEPPQKPQSDYKPMLPFSDAPLLSFLDATATSMLTGFLSKHNVRFSVRNASELTLADLRGGPLILVGALNNAWTLRLASRLRFHPRLDPTSNDMWIEDTQHPERHDWKVQWGEAYVNSVSDYAVVSRVQDPTTGEIMIEIGGLGLHGTQVATEFITDPTYLNILSREIKNPHKNVQVVLKTTVIHGESGPPQVLTVYYW
jgi:hypothetical protein